MRPTARVIGNAWQIWTEIALVKKIVGPGAISFLEPK